MGSSRKGADRERRARDVLARWGYEVMRAAGSHGPVDLIAWNTRKARLIQVKSASSVRRRRDIADLKALRAPPHSSVELWVWQGGHDFEIVTVKTRRLRR